MRFFHTKCGFIKYCVWCSWITSAHGCSYLSDFKVCVISYAIESRGCFLSNFFIEVVLKQATFLRLNNAVFGRSI